MKKTNDTKLRREKKLVDSLSRTDAEPKIHEFTTDTVLQVLFDPNTATLLDFLNLFLIDEFFQLISGQTRLYAEQYIEANPENPTSKTWSATTLNDQTLFSTVFANWNSSKTTNQTILQYRSTFTNCLIQRSYGTK